LGHDGGKEGLVGSPTSKKISSVSQEKRTNTKSPNEGDLSEQLQIEKKLKVWGCSGDRNLITKKQYSGKEKRKKGTINNQRREGKETSPLEKELRD